MTEDARVVSAHTVSAGMSFMRAVGANARGNGMDSWPMIERCRKGQTVIHWNDPGLLMASMYAGGVQEDGAPNLFLQISLDDQMSPQIPVLVLKDW